MSFENMCASAFMGRCNRRYIYIFAYLFHFYHTNSKSEENYTIYIFYQFTFLNCGLTKKRTSAACEAGGGGGGGGRVRTHPSPSLRACKASICTTYVGINQGINLYNARTRRTPPPPPPSLRACKASTLPGCFGYFDLLSRYPGTELDSPGHHHFWIKL